MFRREAAPTIKWSVRQRSTTSNTQQAVIAETTAERTYEFIGPTTNRDFDPNAEILWLVLESIGGDVYGTVVGNPKHDDEQLAIVEQVDPETNVVVRRYRSCKHAARTMQLKYDRLYMRCYNQGDKSTPLGNFLWRFYVPNELESEEFDEDSYVDIDTLLSIRFAKNADEVIAATSHRQSGGIK